MSEVDLLEFEFLVASILLVNILFALFLLSDDLFGALLVLFVLDYETDRRRAIGSFFPPLNLVVVDDCIPLVACDFSAFISEH
jgi:hypothetical protein